MITTGCKHPETIVEEVLNRSYRGWRITLEMDDWWYAWSPNYDASWEGEEDGWVDNGEKVSGRTLEEVYVAIDDWFEENQPPIDPLNTAK